MGARVVLHTHTKKVNRFCAYLQGWLKYKMDFLKHLKKLKNSIFFFKLHMHHEESAQCLATDQRLPGIKAPPRQLRLLLVEAGYDPDPTTGEGNKW